MRACGDSKTAWEIYRVSPVSNVLGEVTVLASQFQNLVPLLFLLTHVRRAECVHSCASFERLPVLQRAQETKIALHAVLPLAPRPCLNFIHLPSPCYSSRPVMFTV